MLKDLQYIVFCLTLLLVATAESWSQQPPPSSGAPNKPPQAQTQRTEQPTATDQRGTEEYPAFVKIIPTPKTADETDQEARDRKEKSTTDWWIVRWTGAVAIFTLVLVGVGAWQGIQLKRTVDLGLDTAQRDLRAYLLLEDTFFIYKGEHRTDAPSREYTDVHKIRIKNFGRTPAFDMSVWLHRSPTEIPLEEIDGHLVKTHSEQPLAPGHRYGPNFAIENPFRHTDDFFFYGKLIYRDIYERWWVTRFGWQYQEGERFRPHGHYHGERGPFSSKPI
jgi:hypothetical protein